MANTFIGRQGVRVHQMLMVLRGSAGRMAAWLALCLLLDALLWGATLSKQAHDRATLRENARRQAASLSKAYAEQLTRSVQQIDQITLSIKYYWKETGGALKLEKQMQEGLYPATAHLYVTIVDREGRRITSTMEGGRGGPNLAQRDYFAAHRSDPAAGLLISEPVPGLRTGKVLTRFSRRLETADGSFDGVVIVSVEPAYLASFTDESTLGRNDFLSVSKTDGALLASKVGENMRTLSGIFRSTPAFSPATRMEGVASMPPEQFVDEQPRLIAHKALALYPLVSVVGLSEQDILDAYQPTADDYQRLALVGSAFLLFIALAGMISSYRAALRKQQADAIKHTYRLATDGAREGFYMVRALYRQHEVSDFVVEDCNERGASYYGTTRQNLVGTRVSDLYSSEEYAQEVIAIFRGAMETGYFEDEFKVSPFSSLQPSWIHRRLVRSGDGLAVTLRDISDIKANEEALSRLANADAVTTLPNRHWMMNYLPTAIEHARSRHTELALLFVDLDDFKNINDTMGHAAGDELLLAVANRLRSVIRPQDNVVRLGGDEFTVILERVEKDDDVSRVAGRIIKSLGEPFVLSNGSSHAVRASIGISIYPQDGGDGETLLKHADIAMYAAKSSGKGHYEFYQPHLSEKLLVRLNKEQALRRAIAEDEFVLYYQPRVDAFSGELRGMEALVRWVHPEHGVVQPQEFIPMAEDTGLVVKLGELVIKKACAQLAQWREAGLPVVPVSVNVSPRQFDHGNLSALFASCMVQYQLDATLIEIEVTESCMVGEDTTVAEELAAIEALGFKLLVDDFGTGYSSLSQLQRLDMDVLKVDKAFTAQLCSSKEGEAFFMAILSMAHVLGMSVVAEGVETVEQLRVLQALSCNEIQGYLISPPLPAAGIPALLEKRFLFPDFEALRAGENLVRRGLTVG